MKPSTLNHHADYEAAVQELDGPAEARLARAFAWLVFQAAALFCWIEAVCRRRRKEASEPRDLGSYRDEPSLHTTRCPNCHALHTNGSFFCSDPCAHDFFNLAHAPSASVEAAGPGRSTVLTPNQERTAV